MPIVINEFEIDVAPPRQAARGEGGDEPPSAQQAAAKAKPDEIITVVRLQQERVERLRAD